MLENISIRRAQSGDETILATIQTESWKSAFAQIIEPNTLDQLTDLDRASEMYRKILEQQKGYGYLLEIDGKPHCLAWWDAARDERMKGYAELIAIHSLPDNWHKGYGSKMLSHILEDVQNAGYDKIMLWVFSENKRAIRFYKAHGFYPSGLGQLAFGAVEVVYERQL